MYRVLLCIACLFVIHRRRPDTVSFSTPMDPTREMISVDTRSRGVLPQDRKSMTIALTGDKEYLHCRDQDYFPLTFPSLLPHGKDCGWHPDLVSTTGRKITMLQWVTQLLLTESRFQRLGPVVNEFLIDVFSCIEDERLAFHANNQDKYTSSLHNASGQHRLPRHVINGTTSTNHCIIPTSCTSGFAHKAKKATEGMAILRHLGPPDYFITMTCNKVNPMLYLPPFASPHKTVHYLMSSIPTTSSPVIHVFLTYHCMHSNHLRPHTLISALCLLQNWPEIERELHPGQTAFDRPALCSRIFKLRLDALIKVTSCPHSVDQHLAWHIHHAHATNSRCVIHIYIFFSLNSIGLFRQVLPKVLGSVVYHLGVIEF